EFNARIYAIIRAVPPGRTITYGEIAKRLGGVDARDVGQAMGQNPFPPIVPCHRVVAAGQKRGGVFGPGRVGPQPGQPGVPGARAAGTLRLSEAPARRTCPAAAPSLSRRVLAPALVPPPIVFVVAIAAPARAAAGHETAQVLDETDEARAPPERAVELRHGAGM